MALLPLKELRLPPVAPMSPTAKPLIFSLAEKVRVIVASLVIELLTIALEPSDAVIVMIGEDESLFCFTCAP